MTSRITNCDCSHWRLFTCPLPTVFVVCHSFRRGYVCVGRGGMVTKHRFKNSSLHDWKSFFSLSVFVRCDPLYDTVSACVWCHSKLWGITNTGFDGTSGTFQSSGGPRPLSKLSHWKTAPLPFNNTHHQRDTGRGEREGEGRRGRSLLYFQASLSCCFKLNPDGFTEWKRDPVIMVICSEPVRDRI